MNRAVAFAVWALLGVVLLVAPGAGAYSDLSLSVTLALREDGTAHVTETTLVSLNTKEEIEAFDFSIANAVTLVDWRKYSSNVNYHTNGPVTNIAISGKRDVALPNVGTISLSYDVNGSVAQAVSRGSRITSFVIASDVLAFDQNQLGETVLRRGTELTIQLPPNSAVTGVAPAPNARGERTLTWRGPLSGAWRVEYHVEKPLSTEVNEFFLEAYQRAVSSIPLLLLALLAAFLAFKVIKSRK